MLTTLTQLMYPTAESKCSGYWEKYGHPDRNTTLCVHVCIAQCTSSEVSRIISKLQKYAFEKKKNPNTTTNVPMRSSLQY